MEPNNAPKTTGWTGWVGFASIVMMLNGILQFFYGLGGIFNQHWYIATPNGAILLDIGTWGWGLLIVGILLFTSGWLLLAGNMFGRVIGIIAATLSLIFNLAMLGITPVWSLLAIVVDALVIYAIAAHGGEMKHLAQDQR